MYRSLIAAALLCVSTSTNAKPVFLECGSAEKPISVSLNEDRGTVTYTQNGETKTQAASFGPDFVTWGSKGLLAIEFKVDRSTLQFTRKYQVVNNPPLMSEGKCRLAASKKRAF